MAAGVTNWQLCRSIIFFKVAGMASGTRILFCIASLKVGGAEVQLQKLVEGLSKRSYECHVIAFEDGPLRSGIDASAGSVKIIDAPPLLRLIRLILSVRRLKPSIIHNVGASAGVYGRLAGIFNRVPAIFASERSDPAYQGKRQRMMERLMARFTSVMLCNSAHAAEYYRSKKIYAPGKVQVIHNAIDAASEKPPLAHVPDFWKIGYLANFRRLKNHSFLLEVLHEQLSTKGACRFSFVLGGTGEELPPFQQAVSQAGLETYFQFLGPVADKDAFFQEIDIYCHVSSYEGCSNSLLEALLRGLPSIAADIPANREIIDHGVSGWLYAADSPHQFLSVLHSVFQAPVDEIITIGRRGRTYVAREFSAQRMIEAHVKLYERF